ncbi:protein of unknown function [Pararobbsia alpina]
MAQSFVHLNGLSSYSTGLDACARLFLT